MWNPLFELCVWWGAKLYGVPMRCIAKANEWHDYCRCTNANINRHLDKYRSRCNEKQWKWLGKWFNRRIYMVNTFIPGRLYSNVCVCYHYEYYMPSHLPPERKAYLKSQAKYATDLKYLLLLFFLAAVSCFEHYTIWWHLNSHCRGGQG